MQQRSANKRRSSKKRFALPVSIKIALMGLLAVCVAVGVFLIPSPEKQHKGSIELHGNTPEIEVYGPELPVNIVEGFSNTPVESIIVAGAEEEDNTLYVYAAKDGKCYHLSTCKFAYASAQRLTVYEASMLGYTPCGRCNPPAYTSDMNP